MSSYLRSPEFREKVERCEKDTHQTEEWKDSHKWYDKEKVVPDYEEETDATGEVKRVIDEYREPAFIEEVLAREVGGDLDVLRVLEEIDAQCEQEFKAAGLVENFIRNFRIRGNGGRVTPEDLGYLKQEYGGICPYCNKPIVQGEYDHITPVSKGGSSNIDNLVWVCKECNREKHTNSLLLFLLKRRH